VGKLSIDLSEVGGSEKTAIVFGIKMKGVEGFSDAASKNRESGNSS